MELLPKNVASLKDLWQDPETRQDAQIVLLKALEDIELPLTTFTQFLSNLDDLLIDREEETKPKRDPAI